MRSGAVCLIALIVCGLSIAAMADPPDPETNPTAARIDEVMRAYAERGRFQGSVLVASDGEVVYRRGFGPANVASGIPNTPETRHRIAWLGTAFTAAIILQLADEGRLDPDDAIAKYLPAYRSDYAERITLHHLLGHTSGIPGRQQDWVLKQYRAEYTLDDLVELANVAGLQFAPGGRYRYSINGYNLLAAIIAHETGKPFEQVLRERILEPAGMRDTGLLRHDVSPRNHASRYNQLLWGELEAAPDINESYAVGAGGMYSTVEDLYRWDRALNGDELISKASRERMFTPGLDSVGYGWRIGSYADADGRSNTLISAYGETSGAAAVMVRLVEDRHLIVLLGNIREVPRREIVTNLTNVLVGLPAKPITPPLKPLYEVLVDQGLDAAVERFAGSPDLPTENLVNQLGYELMRRGRLNTAIRVFQFNVAAYPQAWNTYDSLAEGYMEAGDYLTAVEYYNRSLQLNPGNGNGRMMLLRLSRRPGPF